MPFYQFYDTVHTFLESAIRRVIDRCQNAADANDGLEQQDVNVLKLLYLVRYIEDVKANIENIAILMIDDIHTDKITVPRAVVVVDGAGIRAVLIRQIERAAVFPAVPAQREIADERMVEIRLTDRPPKAA